MQPCNQLKKKKKKCNLVSIRRNSLIVKWWDWGSTHYSKMISGHEHSHNPNETKMARMVEKGKHPKGQRLHGLYLYPVVNFTEHIGMWICVCISICLVKLTTGYKPSPSYIIDCTLPNLSLEKQLLQLHFTQK